MKHTLCRQDAEGGDGDEVGFSSSEFGETESDFTGDA